MGTHPIFESDFDCLTECYHVEFAKSSAQWFVMDLQVPQNIHQLLLIVKASQDDSKLFMDAFLLFTFGLVHWQTTPVGKLTGSQSESDIFCHFVRIKTYLLQ